MTARNRVVREPYATWCGRTPVEIIHGLLPDLLELRSKPSSFSVEPFVEVPPEFEEDAGEEGCVAVGVVVSPSSTESVPFEQSVESVAAALRRNRPGEHERVDDGAAVLKSRRAGTRGLKLPVEPEKVHCAVMDHDGLAAHGFEQLVRTGRKLGTVLELAVLNAVHAPCTSLGAAVRVAPKVQAPRDVLLDVRLDETNLDEAPVASPRRFGVEKDEGLGPVERRMHAFEPRATLRLRREKIGIESGSRMGEDFAKTIAVVLHGKAGKKLRECGRERGVRDGTGRTGGGMPFGRQKRCGRGVRKDGMRKNDGHGDDSLDGAVGPC